MVWFVGGFGRQGFGAGLVMMLATAGWADAVTSVSYACERGTAIMASYLNVEGKSFAVVTAEGHQVAMELAKGSAGARYVSLDTQAPYSWWTENDRGILSYGRSTAETLLFQDCHEQ